MRKLIDGSNNKSFDIAVTGGAGYIGSVLVPHLLSAGHRVHVIDNLQYGGYGLIGIWEHPCFYLFDQDIRDQKSLLLLVRNMDIIIHLAGIVGKPACFEDEDRAWLVNYITTCDLVNISESLGVKHFIFASTCSNYGINELATETSALNPLSIYARTKVRAETCVLSSKIPISTVLRFATVYGISPRMRFDLLLNEFVRDALGRGLSVRRPDSWRPLVHICDVARAVELCIERQAGGIFNIGGHNRKKRDLVETLTGLPLPTQIIMESDENKESLRDYKVSFEKVKSLGFAPAYSPEDSIRTISYALMANIFGDPYDERYRNDRAIHPAI